MTEHASAAEADIGIVTAIPLELAEFLKRCDRVRKYRDGELQFRGGLYSGARVANVETHVGFARARAATRSLIESHAPAWVLSCGFSGALRDDVSSGDVVVASELVDTHGNELHVDVGMPSAPGLHVGRLLVADKFVLTVAEKRELEATHSAIAVDLESLAVAQVCRDLGVRFMAIRVINDDTRADLPTEALSLLASTGSVRLGAAATSVWKRPGSIRDLWGIRENARRASERLADFLDGIIGQLAPVE